MRADWYGLAKEQIYLALNLERFRFFPGHLLKPFYTPPAPCIMSVFEFAKASARRLRHERLSLAIPLTTGKLIA